MTGGRRRAAHVGQYGAVLVAALTLNFFLPHLAPGDPIAYMGADVGGLSDPQIEQVRAAYGLDRPLPEQYAGYWGDLLRGDLGQSVRYSQSVAPLVLERLPWTVLLVGSATVVSALLGTLAGAAAAWRRGTRRDVTLTSGVLTVDSMPAFWIGMVLVGVFAVELGLFPSHGAQPPGAVAGSAGWLLGVAHRLVLPASTIALATMGGTFLLTRGAMLSTLDEPYVRMAQAKGVSERRVVLRHALRNALLPAYTHVTLSVGTLLGGAVVVETVFAYPGVGRLIFEGVVARDYPLVRGTFLFLTVGVIAANLLADLTYPLLDPRVRRPAGRGVDDVH